MIAIVEIGGKQYTVKVGDTIEVDRQGQEDGAEISVKPLLVASEDGSSVRVGTPVLEDASVSLKVVNSFRGEKITVFKMKSKKRYSRTRGFRPELTALTVTAIA